jgi:hypothetical protein
MVWLLNCWSMHKGCDFDEGNMPKYLGDINSN